MKIIAVTNQKGGVGKSTTALALGAGLIRKNYRVLFIDLDAQCNLSSSMGASLMNATKWSIMHVLYGETRIGEAVQKAPLGDIIAGSPAMAGADIVISSTGKEYRLKEALGALGGAYDYVIIDTPPALGILTVNALTASTGCIIPAQADVYSLQGIAQLFETIRAVKKYCNPALAVMGIIITRFSPRLVIAREIAEMLQDTAAQLDTRLYGVKIRECAAIREAQAVKKDIYEYAPKSNAASDYAAFTDEFLKGDM